MNENSSTGNDTETNTQKEIDLELIEGSQARLLPFRQLMIVYSCISTVTFLVAIDSLIVATRVPNIVEEFHSLNQISWLTNAFMLTQTLYQPMF
ncbi:uncharacterized protein VTP21DRAFT_9564 [Calcarisporiella thermophila]|uniref:uncharacterized protein n=1 Tax=Calcarisporiella thermophila TaxID=911321 RepID=UPI0037436EB7